jgi:hypothetical protein
VPVVELVCVGVALLVPLAESVAVFVGGMNVADAVGVQEDDSDVVEEGVSVPVPVLLPVPVGDVETVDVGVEDAVLVDEGVGVGEGVVVPVREREALGEFDAVALAEGVQVGLTEDVGVTVLHIALPAGVVEPAGHAWQRLPAAGA